MSCARASSTRSGDPTGRALERANEVRVARARLKQAIREGTVRLEEILVDPPEHTATARIIDLLLAVPKCGPVRARRLLNTARISPSKTVGALSDRQRVTLVELLLARSQTPRGV